MENAKTTPEDVISAVGALIVDMTDNGYNDGELIDVIEVYTKLVKTVKMHPSAATPECISVPVYFGDKLVDTVKIPT